MLSHLLTLLAENRGELTLEELARRLGASPAAVEGMLATLLHKGRIVEIRSDCGICSDCPLDPGCVLPARRARRFRLAGSKLTPPARGD